MENNYQNNSGPEGWQNGYPNGAPNNYPGKGPGGYPNTGSNGYPNEVPNGYPGGGPGGYPGPGPDQGPVVINQLEQKKDGHAVSALVLGILSIVFCWCLGIPIVIGIIGLIMGIISLVKTGQHSGVALAGVITSAIGMVLGFALILLYIAA